MQEVTITIDPGLEFGYALWDFLEYQKNNPRSLFSAGIFKSGSGWKNKLLSTTYSLSDLCEVYKIRKAVIEQPQFFASSGGTMVAARGDLIKLSMAAGAVAGVVGLYCRNVIFAPVTTWKGQLPKKIVEQRIFQIYDQDLPVPLSSHMWDAVGIGLWDLGVL